MVLVQEAYGEGDPGVRPVLLLGLAEEQRWLCPSLVAFLPFMIDE